MAAMDTFEWFVQKFHPHADASTSAYIQQEREYLLTIRNEHERLRYIGELMKLVREKVSRTTT